MSHVVKIAILSAVALLGLETAVPTPASASPVLVQSRMQQMLDRSARRQARLREDRLFAAEEARIAAEAEAARRAEAEEQAAAAQAQTAVASPAAKPADDDATEAEDEAEADSPTPQV